MAHLRTLDRTCQSCESRKAKVELFNNRNESWGVYCDPCGVRKRAELEAKELKEFSRGKG